MENKLSIILQHYSGTSTEEAEWLYALTQEYPYSQVIQALAARAAQDHHHALENEFLQRAAVYSTDRAALKQLMSEATSVLQQVSKSNQTTAKSASDSTEAHQVLTSSKSTVTDYADEVIHDLERLQELKHDFEAYFEGTQEPKTEKVTVPKAKQPEEKEEIESKPDAKKLSKKERIVQLAKELNKVPPSPEEPAWAEKPIKKVKGKNTELEPLVNEIKSTRKKVQPESEKTREQIEIIEQFIKSNPLITPPKSKPAENQDLASSLKSGEFGDHIISETLAEILIRQGKKDKAIEVYKKLIWKFPQKKAYFAAQIEELRK